MPDFTDYRAMSDQQLAAALRGAWQLRVGPAMQRYVRRKLAEQEPFYVMGDATRSGLPRRILIHPAEFAARTAKSPGDASQAGIGDSIGTESSKRRSR